MAELAAAFSVVTDAALGLEEGQGIRSCVLAMRLAERLQLPPEDRAALFWIGLLRYGGPTALRDGQASCAVAARFSMPSRVVTAIGEVFRRWDGTGEPVGALGGDIDVAVRMWQVAHTADLIATTQRRGRRAVPASMRRRAGRSLDPDLARAGAAAVDLVGQPAGLADLLPLEPEPHLLVDNAAVDAVLPTFGAVADAVAPYLDGHSDRVSQLAGAAGAAAGLPPHDVTLLRRAGWVHDVGRVAVAPQLWLSTSAVDEEEDAQLRTHPQHTRRLLAHTPGLAALAPVASAHHERLDGSGYPQGRGGAAFGRTAWILAAADAYVSAGEHRPHRPARPAAEQAYLLLGLARDGRLPHDAVDAVIAAVNGAGR